jgi:Secretion system C-terminal sorting domain
MKFLVIVILIFAKLNVNAQWSAVYEFPFSSESQDYDIEYNGDGKLFLLRNHDVIVSQDQGLSWNTSYFSEEQGQFRQIYFSSPDTGYMVKASGPGLFLRTYNAGMSWETVTPIAGVYSEEATSVLVFDQDHLYFSIWDGASGKIVWTKDGGLTTQLAYPAIWEESGISAVACKNEDSCIALSGFPRLFGTGGNGGICPVYRTSNCCEEWEWSSWMGGGAFKLQFRNWNLMYAVTPYYVFSSIDQFQTLDTIKVLEYPTEQFTELHFVNDSVGYLAAKDISLPAEALPTCIYRTTDYGNTWEKTYLDWSSTFDSLVLNAAVYNIDCIDEYNCYLMASTLLFHTTNGGFATTSDFEKLSLILHPNPTSSTLNITGLEAYQIENITTYSIDGRIVDLPFQNGQVDVSHLAPGIYLTTVQTEQGKWQEKWVKME